MTQSYTHIRVENYFHVGLSKGLAMQACRLELDPRVKTNKKIKISVLGRQTGGFHEAC